MTAKLSAEEKSIIEYVESDRAISIDNVENEETIFLKNIIPSRKYQKKYLIRSQE